MTFFRAEKVVQAPQAQTAGVSERGARGGLLPVPDRQAEEAERLREFQAAVAAAGQLLVGGEVLDGRGRPPGVVNTVARNNRTGLSHTQVVERAPRGILFRLGHGWFDKDGFWCVADAKGKVTVTRGTNKEMMARLNKDQKALLDNARLRARKAGVR